MIRDRKNILSLQICSLLGIDKKLAESKIEVNKLCFPRFPSNFFAPYTFFDLAKDTIEDHNWLKSLNKNPAVYLDGRDRSFSSSDIYANINRFLRAIVMRNELSGGFLIHGIMLRHRKKNQAIIFAGDSGVGKTTASIRMPDDVWQKCSDDVTLIVRDGDRYYAHAWPGSKAYMKPELRYDTENAVPLSALFFLKQSNKVYIKPVETLESIANLQRLINEHASLPDPSIDPKKIGEMRKQRLENIATFVKKIPIFYLNLNRTDPFWDNIREIIFYNEK